jgi:peptidyl-prolyl cis-trans isomerase C
MQTPDGKEFSGNSAQAALRKGAAAMGGALVTLIGACGALAVALLRALAKFVMTAWRLAAALDSALWRATKLLLRKSVDGLVLASALVAMAFGALLLWLPTRTGRAYSAFCGVVLVVALLWIIDELRAGPGAMVPERALMGPPIDEEDPILARIEGRYVHLSEIESAARAAGFLRDGEILTPAAAFERGLVESYVEQRLLARAALEEGLQRAPGVLRRVNAARDRILASSFMERKVDERVTPETVERFYQSQRDITQLGDEVRARHILVSTGEEAENIMRLLAEGGDFSALARERSLDRATAPLGGEVGWFTRSMMTPDFARAAFSATPGEIAPPFQTEFGWHIVEILDRRPTQSVPLSDIRDRIEDFLRMQAIDDTVEALAQQSNVVYFRPDIQRKPDLRLPPDLTAPGLTTTEAVRKSDAIN